jgi:protein gp37
MANWNPWHGCSKYSEGCLHCYVYRQDERYGRDSSNVARTKQFALPVKRRRDGTCSLLPDEPNGIVYTCFTSDFLLDKADGWRADAWKMMRERSDLTFLFITKRIQRFMDCIPGDWGDGYENVRVCTTVENQLRAEQRLPVFRDLPIRHKSIVCEPMLTAIDLGPYLGDWVKQVIVGGESGEKARALDFNWVLEVRDQCAAHGIPFHFKQTGARFVKDGRLYNVARRFQHVQAQKACIDLL